MSKKTKINVDELEKAIHKFECTEDYWIVNMTDAHNKVNLSDSWNSESGKKFRDNMLITYGEAEKIRSTCRELKKYCEDIAKKAKRQNNLLQRFTDWLAETTGGLINRFLTKLSDMLNAFGL